MTAESPRHAIYYAPDSRSARWRFGSSVIGYDAVSGTDVPFLTTAGMSTAEWSGLTAEPRQYGFHATLKAPFNLNPHAGKHSSSAHFTASPDLVIRFRL